MKTKDDSDRALIQRAMAYRSGPDSCNSLYMGSMSIAMLYRIVGATYGKPGFDEHLAAASRTQLDAALAHCDYIIRHMRQYPTKKCPTCGGIVTARRKRNVLSANPETKTGPETLAV